MPLVPSILKTFFEDDKEKDPELETYVCEEKDQMALEDPTSKIRINKERSNLNIHECVTGIAMAAKGYMDTDGLFVVNDYAFYHPPINTPNPLTNTNDAYILLVSGLSFGCEEEKGCELEMARSQLLEFIQHKIANPNSQMAYISNNLIKVIFAGNNISPPPKIDEFDPGRYLKEELNKTLTDIMLANYENLDKYLFNVASFVPIDIMPGPDDFSTAYFPDSEISPIMFPTLKKLINKKVVKLAQNPYVCDINGTSFIGTAGNNIQIMKKYCLNGNGIKGMDKTLQWGNLSPCCPDSVCGFPYTDKDPLILEKFPDIYFTGNGDNFEWEIKEYYGRNTILFTIPKFSQSFTGVLFNLGKRTVETISFNNKF